MRTRGTRCARWAAYTSSPAARPSSPSRWRTTSKERRLEGAATRRDLGLRPAARRHRARNTASSIAAPPAPPRRATARRGLRMTQTTPQSRPSGSEASAQKRRNRQTRIKLAILKANIIGARRSYPNDLSSVAAPRRRTPCSSEHGRLLPRDGDLDFSRRNGGDRRTRAVSPVGRTPSRDPRPVSWPSTATGTGFPHAVGVRVVQFRSSVKDYNSELAEAAIGRPRSPRSPRSRHACNAKANSSPAPSLC